MYSNKTTDGADVTRQKTPFVKCSHIGSMRATINHLSKPVLNSTHHRLLHIPPLPPLILSQKSLRRLLPHKQRQLTYGKIRDEAQARQATHDRPNSLQAIRIRLADLLLHEPFGHRVDDLDQTGRIARVRRSHGRQVGIGQEVGVHLVLEDDAADGDAEGLAESAEEGEHGDGEGEVGGFGGRLHGEGHAGEEDAEPEAGG